LTQLSSSSSSSSSSDDEDEREYRNRWVRSLGASRAHRSVGLRGFCGLRGMTGNVRICAVGGDPCVGAGGAGRKMGKEVGAVCAMLRHYNYIKGISKH